MADKLEVFNASDDWYRQLCGNRFITNSGDFNLKEGSKSTDKLDLFPITGGLYDGRLFGSLYPKRCNCGAVHTVGERCHTCNTDVLSEAQRAVRYCGYNATVCYSNEPRMKVLAKRLYEMFDKVQVRLEDQSGMFYDRGFKWKNLFNLCQFNFIKEGNQRVLEITDDLTDFDKISFEGLRSVIDQYLPEYSTEIRTYFNKIIPILPIALRPVRLSVFGVQRKLEVSPHTIMYRALIQMDQTYSELIDAEDDIYKSTLLKATLREFIGNQLYNLSEISKGSKSNFFRTAYTHRVAGSGRAVISPDTSLRYDSCGIPMFLAYEMYKLEFIAYIEATYFIEHHEAETLYKQADPDILDLFKVFIEDNDKHVFLNRNPTLHKYNILCLKVVLVPDATIHLPQSLCELYGGDYDGDELNFFAIPNELKDYAVENASPKNMIYYEKDHSFLFKFNHESLNGVIISSKCILQDEEPKKFISFDDVQAAFDNSDIEVDTAIEFDNKITSYGRIKIGKIINADLDVILGENVPFNAKNVSVLYGLLSKYDPETRVSMFQKLQEFVLEMVYLSGETTLKLEEVYQELPEEFINEIKEIMNSDEYTTEEKMMYIQERHENFLRDYINGMDSGVRLRIEESSRMKINAYIEMNTPQILYGANSSVSVSEGTLINGLTEAEYVSHALNNRKLLELKFKAVPTSGYLTRQLTTLGEKLILRKGDDPENEGILLPRNRVEGRTLIDGAKVGKSNSDELVRVRSILSSTKDYLTQDMISTFNRVIFDQDGIDHKGVSFMMALTESSTQKGLSLKHGGALRTVIESSKLRANQDCKLELYEKFFILEYEDGYIAKYPRTNSMSFMMNKTEFKKGDLICQLNKTHTFSYTLDCVIKLVKAVGRVTLDDVKNYIEPQRCISVCDGIVRYNFNEGYMSIGSELIKIKPDTLYLVPDGEEVKVGENLCTGLENIQALSNRLTYIELYAIFRAQFRILMPHIAEEIIEALYFLITNKNEGSFNGVLRSNMDNNSLIPNLAFGYAKRGLARAISGASEIKSDSYSNSIITPFLTSDMMKVIERNRKKVK